MLLSLNFQAVPVEKEPVVYAIPFFLLLIGIELYVNWKEQRNLYNKGEAVSSIVMGLGSLVVNILMKALAFAFYTWLFQFRLFDIVGIGGVGCLFFLPMILLFIGITV